MEIDNTIYVAAESNGGSVILIGDNQIASFCNKYNKGFESFFCLCKNQFIYRKPNADIVRFNYCPISGKKIDWEKIYETWKRSFNDYDENIK